MCKVYGAKHVIIADIQAERVDFAVAHRFADAKIVVPMKRPQAIEEKLAFAREVAELVKAQAGGEEVDAVFECTGVESCLQAAIYVRPPSKKIPPSPPFLSLPNPFLGTRGLRAGGFTLTRRSPPVPQAG